MNQQALSKLLCVSLWFLLSSTVSYGGLSDIACLKAFKQSLQDPFNNFETWKLDDNTEGIICSFIGVECWQAVENRVLNIQLSGMGLKGEFPKGLESCSSITGLNLSNNELSGMIPPDIDKKIPYVTLLDLSSNHFSGNIPPQLGSSSRSKGADWPVVDAADSTNRGCKFLNVLKLDNNRLTGQIPPQVGNLERLRIFSVTNNFLSGPIPDFANLDLSPDSFANNSGLCGKPLEDCKGKRKLAVNMHIVIFGLVVYLVVTPLSSLCWYRLLFAGKRKKSSRTVTGGRRASRGAA